VKKETVNPVTPATTPEEVSTDVKNDQAYHIDVSELDALGDLSDLDLDQFLEKTKAKNAENPSAKPLEEVKPDLNETDNGSTVTEDEPASDDPFALAEQHLIDEVSSLDGSQNQVIEPEKSAEPLDEPAFSTDDLEESLQNDGATSNNQVEVIHAETEQPTNDLEKLQRVQERLIRVTADFENFRKRAQRDIDSVALYANEQLLRALLPIIDNLERALENIEHTEDAEAMNSGVEMVLRQLQKELRHHGVTSSSSVGEMFDPRIHEAFEAIPTNEHKPGEILKELQKGYSFRERMLRPAMVSVATALSNSGKTAPKTDEEDVHEEFDVATTEPVEEATEELESTVEEVVVLKEDDHEEIPK
jgi:molecular chaperone GrpE